MAEQTDVLNSLSALKKQLTERIDGEPKLDIGLALHIRRIYIYIQRTEKAKKILRRSIIKKPSDAKDEQWNEATKHALNILEGK